MLDQNLRIYKEQLLVPVASRLQYSIHPTTVTVVAGVVGIAAAVAAWQQMYVVGLGLWVANRILDGLDGTIARRTNRQTDFGGYLDMVLDNLVYSAIVVGLAAGINTAPAYLAMGVLLAVYYVNAASWMYLSSILEKRAQGAKASGEMTSVTMPPGLVEGTETLLFYVVFFLFAAWVVPLFWIFAALVMFTTGQRIVWAARSIND